jgi:hypothetical protein
LIEKTTQNCKEKVTSRMESNKDPIPEEIPREKSKHIDDIKKRRSSLRRSITGGSGSTFRSK